mmetsp:Transcript_30198/g.79317  ORF Transcript_30198/g.79317 Transcript_30198/m.79317 type:complete len:215 (-) Transcript_30198:124-768(-)|eukprot:CAMPEP_0182917278 /NCGR_PEP_ID=MMETSP0105_2-20130417/1432_1 /TAXON_ID=81532 ORGANISM="Acanthoeca-like sp., Strain 10tr" /NCGR_SAMPLE_ID=MMETSP0105_2 /ASSEMBLY_ACC=CAM_ASM_000205 /LENGTH=214 /DNA_ID=CAMNT_0025054273 /DNA_START=220 /DNA_END=864 /DNA_ORIENTATION=+
MSSITTIFEGLLGPLLPSAGPVRDAVLMISPVLLGAIFTAILTINFTWDNPGSDVPYTLQTLAVLIVGGVFGMSHGAAAEALYVYLGGIGFPIFAGGASGWDVVYGPTGGYLIAFIAAAGVVGRLCELGWDLQYHTAYAAMVTGTVIIWAIGAWRLGTVLNLTLWEAFMQGVAPFMVFDLIKAASAALVVVQLKPGIPSPVGAAAAATKREHAE